MGCSVLLLDSKDVADVAVAVAVIGLVFVDNQVMV